MHGRLGKLSSWNFAVGLPVEPCTGAGEGSMVQRQLGREPCWSKDIAGESHGPLVREGEQGLAGAGGTLHAGQNLGLRRGLCMLELVNT